MDRDDPDSHKRKSGYMGLLQLCAKASSSTSEESVSQGTSRGAAQESSCEISSLGSQGPASEEVHENKPVETAEQKQAWLQKVLDSMAMSLSAAQVMERYVHAIRHDLYVAASEGDVSQELSSSLAYSLDALMNDTDMLDNAIDFHKIGGFDVLRPLLEIQHPVIRAKTLELIAVLVQNNTYCQNQVIEAGLLPELFEVLDQDENEAVCVKALYAISCLCRHNASILHHLIEVDGIARLLCALQKPSEKMRIKAAFLLTSLIHDLPEIRDVLFNLRAVQKISTLLQEEFRPAHEYLLGALLELVSQHQPSQMECQNPELKLKDSLLAHMCYIQNSPEYLEANAYLSRLFNYCVPDDVVFDEFKTG